MASYQYAYHMHSLTKAYPGGKKVLDNVHLSFFPDAKIGVLGNNGSGKSTLLRIMAGIDKEFSGEARPADGIRVGYLPQEPQLDPTKSIRENVMDGVAKQVAILARYNDLAMNYSEETADEMTRLQDEIEAQGLWDLDSKVDQAMGALRCPPDDADIANDLMRVLVEKIRGEAFLDRKKLHALSLVVHYGGSRLDANFVLEALSLVSKNLQSIRVRDEALILQCLDSVTDLLDAVMTLDVLGAVKVETVQEIFDCLTHLRSASTSASKAANANTSPAHRLIVMELEYAKQSLLRITSQKTDLEKLFTSTYSILKGVVKASCAVANKDPMALIEAVIDTYKDGKQLLAMFRDKKQEEWFSHVRVMKVLCASADTKTSADGGGGFAKFRVYYQELFLRLSAGNVTGDGRMARALSSM
ncbi:MAG: hypothetical protein B7X76_05850, partial [Azorhizobium sp. 39-67-5]